jgi:hypothetical protein
MTTYSIFTGCSYTEGIGLADKSKDTDLWVNIVHPLLPGNTQVLNLGKGESSNLEIFHSSIDAVLSHKCQYLFVQWTKLLRYRLNPGVETHDTSINFVDDVTHNVTHSVAVNPDIKYSESYIASIKNRFFDLHHPHYEIIKIIEYSCLIKKLCDRLGVTVWFVNGILPWDADYFVHLQNLDRLPSDTTPYTQQRLNAVSRDDDEYFLLYDKIHSEYKILESVKQNWLNLYSSFCDCFYLDQGLDDLHPGIKSNRAFAQHLVEKIHKGL